MRTHSALHLLNGVVYRDYRLPVTSADMKPLEGRLDFDIPEAGLDKEAIAAKLAEMVATDAAVTSRWISDAELEAYNARLRALAAGSDG